MPIQIPDGIKVEQTGVSLMVNGPKGTLNLTVLPEIKVSVDDKQITFNRKDESKKSKSLHGLFRSLVANMILGVSTGWEKKLELVGVGFRAQGSEDKLTLNIGFSHPVEVVAPEGIIFEVTDNTKIKVSGIDKQLVGQVAANVRSIREPDAYKGKGVRYVGERVRKKPGKSGKVGAK